MNNHERKTMANDYISKLVKTPLPYEKEILGVKFAIKNYNTYPPGSLAKMVGEFIRDSKVAQDKTVLDIAMGSFSFGIFAAKNGAKYVIGSDINKSSIEAAKHNVEINNIDPGMISLYQGNSVEPLLSKYQNQIDLIICGPPWDSMPEDEFRDVEEKSKYLYSAFFDIEDRFMKGLMEDGFKLLTPDGKMLLTSAESHIQRISDMAMKYNVKYKPIFEKDLHNDGNMHYILELSK